MVATLEVERAEAPVEANQVRDLPHEVCGAWWRIFYCHLPKGHSGPHEDTGTEESWPFFNKTSFHVSWEEVEEPLPEE